MAGHPADDTFTALLQRLIGRHGGRQIFVFGSEGAPFWTAFPVTTEDLAKLDVALRLLESLECTHARPFHEFDHRNNLVVAALDEEEDLYFVVLDALQPIAAEKRVHAFRDEIARHSTWLRQEVSLRSATEH